MENDIFPLVPCRLSHLFLLTPGSLCDCTIYNYIDNGNTFTDSRESFEDSRKYGESTMGWYTCRFVWGMAESVGAVSRVEVQKKKKLNTHLLFLSTNAVHLVPAGCWNSYIKITPRVKSSNVDIKIVDNDLFSERQTTKKEKRLIIFINFSISFHFYLQPLWTEL